MFIPLKCASDDPDLDGEVIGTIIAIVLFIAFTAAVIAAAKIKENKAEETEHKLDITALCQADFDTIYSYYDADGNRTLIASDKSTGIVYQIDNDNIKVLYDKDGKFLKEAGHVE